MKYPARLVADAFLAFCGEYGDLLSNLKLQKLLYYAQGWHLALYGEPLFDEPLEAWVHGPVVPDVYRAFKGFGSGPIRPDPAPELKSFPPELVEHVKDVWEAYGNFSAYDLERLSHREPPWAKARNGLAPDSVSCGTLDLADMTAFFKDQAKNG